ncbi:MAG: hypothetical protein ACQEXJ_04805 [Myxococcota bacterium]
MLRPRCSCATATAFVVAVGLLACENSTDESPNVLPIADGDVGGEETSTADGDVGEPDADRDTDTSAPDASAEGCDCIQQGDWYIFDTLGLETIDGGDHNVIDTLNQLWSQDIDKNLLNILFLVESVTNSNVTFKAYNAARVPDSQDICLLRDTEITLSFPLDGCRLLESPEAGINIYAGPTNFPVNCNTENTPQHIIPARRVILRGEMNNDCAAITDGILVRGVIGKRALEQTCTCVRLGGQSVEKCGQLDPEYSEMIEEADEPVCVGCNEEYQSLVELIVAFGVGQQLDYTGLTSDGKPAVTLSGFFSATRYGQTPPDCP